jgi:hypothetical protein
VALSSSGFLLAKPARSGKIGLHKNGLRVFRARAIKVTITPVPVLAMIGEYAARQFAGAIPFKN